MSVNSAGGRSSGGGGPKRSENLEHLDPEERERVEQRRAMYRVNQRRHRERLRQRTTSLEEDTRRLSDGVEQQSEVVRELRQTSFRVLVRAASNRLRTVEDFFTHFTNGLASNEQPELLNAQRKLLKHMFYDDVRVNEQESLAYLLSQIDMYTKLHKSFNIRAISTHVLGTNNIVRVNAVIRVEFSKESLETLYPGLLNPSYLGKVLELPSCMTFFFNGGCVEHLEWEVNYLKGWTVLLSNVKQAVAIVARSQIRQPDGMIDVRTGFDQRNRSS